MSKNIVFEGWLTKSPPTKRIWRAKWRRRWFALRQSGELPGQYFLDYYADRNYRRLKGTINLDLCEQVDAGLRMEKSGSSPLQPRLRGSVFSVRTQSRTYHLEADCEDDMEKWVHAICQVCNLRATEDVSDTDGVINVISPTPIIVERKETSGSPYIPISECITGVRNQDPEAFSNVADSSQVISIQPRPNQELSENESNFSDEECRSLNTLQPVVGDWTVAKSFTKLKVSQAPNGHEGPPVPPRPPKTFAMTKDLMQKETFQGPKFREPAEPYVSSTGNDISIPSEPWRLSGRPEFTSHGRVISRCIEDKDIVAIHHTYFNLLSIRPPAVDRALKPRHSSVGHIHNLISHGGIKSDVLQYLDLDLHTSKSQNKSQDRVKVHGKPKNAEPECVYHTVDFIKTEAFNITRQDAEASRNIQTIMNH